MSFKLGDSLGERRCLVLFLQLRELFLKLGHLFLKHVGLLVFSFRAPLFLESCALFGCSGRHP